MKNIRTKQGLTTLLKRYQEAGVTDETKDASGSYEAHWITCIKQCIDSLDTDEPIGMDETDYENTPDELKPLWRGLH